MSGSGNLQTALNAPLPMRLDGVRVLHSIEGKVDGGEAAALGERLSDSNCCVGVTADDAMDWFAPHPEA